MAKRYDPIMCMLVDEPTKAQDAEKLHYYQHSYTKKWYVVSPDGKVFKEFNTEAEAKNYVSSKAQDAMPSDLKKAGYEVGTVEKYGSTYYTLVYNGKVISTSPTEANIVEKAKKHYANRHGKAQDVAPATQRYINTIVDESKANAEKFVRQAEQDDEVPENELKYVYKAYNEKFGYKFHDSVSALDKAIKTCDGMFQQIFGKYSSAAKQHYDRAVKELDSFKGEIKDYLTLAGKWEMQIRNDLTRIDEAYNTAGNDYYAARREIQETMDSLTQVMLRKAREKRK